MGWIQQMLGAGILVILPRFEASHRQRAVESWATIWGLTVLVILEREVNLQS